MKLSGGDVELELDVYCWACEHGKPNKASDADEDGKCRICGGVGRVTTTDGDELISFMERWGFVRKT